MKLTESEICLETGTAGTVFRAKSRSVLPEIWDVLSLCSGLSFNPEQKAWNDGDPFLKESKTELSSGKNV